MIDDVRPGSDSKSQSSADTGQTRYCRFCGLPVRTGDAHGTEMECIEALRIEIQLRKPGSAPLPEKAADLLFGV